MGRYWTDPTVEDSGYAFIITRVFDPDDEFAETRVLCEDPQTHEFVWDAFEVAYGYRVIEFSRSTQAELFLRGWNGGIQEGLEEAQRILSGRMR